MRFDLHHHPDRETREHLARIEKLLLDVQAKQEKFMADVASILADFADYHAQVNAKIADLNAKLDDVKNQLAAAQGQTAPDLQPVMDAIDAAKMEMQPAPSAVATPPDAAAPSN